jgi:putative Ca2+/H+ antiporter (TMEM165/GDT1 family)
LALLQQMAADDLAFSNSPSRQLDRLGVIMSFAIAATAFLLIFPIELPDKTFIATLVLATRYKPLPVWIGVTSAFLVQTVVAVTLGGLISRLPRTPVEIFVALMFLVGGLILIRGAAKAETEETETEHEFEAKAKAGIHGWRAVGASFVVLFVAEWGDLSQLLTAGLVVKYQDPVSVGVGAFLALATVSALAAILGRTLLKRIRVATIRRIGGTVCLLLAVVTLLQVANISVP